MYFFSDSKTVQTTFPDGLQIFKFNNGQIEKHFTDGKIQIKFPDGSMRYILDGFEETHYKNGTIQKIDKNNLCVIEHKDGTKEYKYINNNNNNNNDDLNKIDDDDDNNNNNDI
jgi:centromere protein J